MTVYAFALVALAVLGAVVPSPGLSRASRELLDYWAALDAFRLSRETSRRRRYVPARAPAPVRCAVLPTPAALAAPEPAAALAAGTLRPVGWVAVGRRGALSPTVRGPGAVRVRTVYQWRGEAHASVERPNGARYRARLADLSRPAAA